MSSNTVNPEPLFHVEGSCLAVSCGHRLSVSHDGNNLALKLTLEQTPLKLGALHTFRYYKGFSFLSSFFGYKNPELDSNSCVHRALFECGSSQATGALPSMKVGLIPHSQTTC